MGAPGGFVARGEEGTGAGHVARRAGHIGVVRRVEVPRGKGQRTTLKPESCGSTREGRYEALAGSEWAGHRAAKS